MKPILKKRIKIIFLVLILTFVALFVFRLIYGYTKNTEDIVGAQAFIERGVSSKKNYASKKYELKSDNSSQAHTKVDQKYEKIAEVSTQSSEFDKEETLVRKEIDKYKGIVQFEQKSGNTGSRKLNLVIGVPPENFDSIYSALIKIGKVKAKEITKKDKTNEYKELNAKKISLENIRNSLVELKNKGGKIEEYIQLENRVLDIEQQLQAIGVSLGDFDNENEFCTVQFYLAEGKENKISLMHRIKVALEWTINFYLKSIVILFFMLLFAYVLSLTIDNLKVNEWMNGKKEQD